MFVRRVVVFVFILTMLAQQQAMANVALAAKPVSNYVVNRMINGTITKVAARRGFAANDPIIAQTQASVSQSLTAVNTVSALAGVGLAIVGAPVWLTVAAGLGVLAIGTALVSSSIDIQVKQQPSAISIDSQGQVISLVQPSTSSPPTNAGTTAAHYADYDYMLSAIPKVPVTPVQAQPNGFFYAMYLTLPGTIQRFYGFTTIGEVYKTDDCLGGYFCDALPYYKTASGYAYSFFPNDDGATINAGLQYVFRNETDLINNYPLPWFMFMNDYSNTTASQYVREYLYTDKKIEVHYSPNGTREIYFSYKLQERYVYMFFSGRSYNVKYVGRDTSKPTSSWSAPLERTIPLFSSNTKKTTLFGLSPTYKSFFYFHPESAPSYYSDLDAFVANQPQATGDARIQEQFLAQMVNNAWSKAAQQQGYEGLPYSYSDPVTVNDVLGAGVPVLLSDLLRPAAPDNMPVPLDPSVTSAPPPQTGTQTGVTPVNVSVNAKVDLGPDPNTAEPTLESPPTAQSILDPVLALLPGFKSYAVPQHIGICPKPEFSLFDKTITMTTHCDIAEEHRGPIVAIMTLVWSLMALFIVLRA